METPPPFHGYQGQPAPQRPKSNGLVILFAILGVLVVCCGIPTAVIGFGLFKVGKGAMSFVGCFGNSAMMSKALAAYEKDHNGKLPSAATWQTDIAPYFKVDQKMKDSPFSFWDAKGEWSCEDKDGKTGFAFNSDLSEKVAAEVQKQDPQAVAIFEVRSVAFNQSKKYEKQDFSTSPKFMGELMKERRGWLHVRADGVLMLREKSGKLVEIKNGEYNFDNGGFNGNVTIGDDDENSPKGAKVKVNSGGGSNDSEGDNSN